MRRQAVLGLGLARLAGWCGLGFLVAASALGASARWHWSGELVVNFGWQLGCGGWLAAGLLLLGGRPRLALCAALLASWQLWPGARLWLPADPPVHAAADAQAPQLRIAHANVLYSNKVQQPFVDWIAREDPELLSILEYSRPWRAAIGAELERRFPYRIETDEHLDRWSGSLCRTLLCSQLPLLDARTLPSPPGSGASIEAWIERAGERVHVIVVHPSRPGERARTAARNALFARLERDTRCDKRTVLLGDLNATAWSPAFADLLSATGLREARQGFGRMPSWVSTKYLPGLWLDLDHVLVGAAIDVLELRCGDDIGSDHLPLIATLRIAPGRALAPAGALGGSPASH